MFVYLVFKRKGMIFSVNHTKNIMKKIIAFIICTLFASIILIACSAGGAADSETKKANSSETVNSTVSTEAASEVKDFVTTQIAETPIEKAKISEADASKMVSNLSMEQLGLEGDKKDYKFMVSTDGKTVDGVDYIEVLAAVVAEKNKDDTFSVETKGDYFVSYDGSKVYSRNMLTGELTEIK